MLFPVYIKLVLRDYREKLKTDDLPLELREPTPASLRDLCLAVYNKRNDRRDEYTLERFFGATSEKESRFQSIERCNINKFKPLIKYLKKSTSKTNPKNIELLAWLIDYKGRPHPHHRPFCFPGGPSIELANGDWESAEQEDIEPEDPDDSEVKGRPSQGTGKQEPRKTRVIKIIVTITIALAAIGFYSMWLHKNSTRISQTPPGTQACMFWAGDHYRPNPCTQKHGDTPVVPLDSEKIACFKKITRLDTITENALGSVWYVKFQGVYECYTSPGYHPIDTSLKLRLLTDFVLLKHIHPGLEPAPLAPSR